MSPRLPQPGGDSGRWGEILNEYLQVEHDKDGKLKNVVRPADIVSKANADDTYSKSEVDSQLSTKLDVAFVDDITPGSAPEIIVGSLSGPARRTAEYDQILRRSGDTLQFRNIKEAYLNDRSDIDPTGVQEMGAIISSYLAELAAKGVTKVYCEPGSIYRISTTIDVPAYMTLEGGMRISQGASVAQQTVFKAANSDMTIFRLAGNYATLRGVKLHLGNLANVVGVRPNRHFQLIENCLFGNGHATSTGVKGGGILYFSMRDNVYSDGFFGRGVDLLNSYADNPVAVYYGVNVGQLERNVFGAAAGGVRAEGIFTIRDNDFEAPYTGLAVEVSTASANSYAVIESNYFEMGGSVNQAILLGSGSTATIMNNRFYGSGQGIVGGCAIKLQSYVYSFNVTGNTISRFETGISGTTITNTLNPGMSIMGNHWSNVTTPINLGNHPSKQTYNGISGLKYIQDGIAGHVFVGRRIVQSSLQYFNDVFEVNLSLANTFDVNQNTSGNLTYINASAGHRFGIYFRSGNATLQNSVWRLISGADETPVAGSYKEFMTDFNGVVREIGLREISGSLKHTGTTAGFFGAPPIARPSALTAADVSSIDGIYGSEERAVIENLRTRVNELEDKLRLLGLLG